jgi:hypothetical protein
MCGGGGGFVSIVTAVVAVVASVVAGPEVGAAIVESVGVEGASEATIAAVGSAAISGGTSAVNAAVQGKNIDGILAAGAEGAAAGAVGSEVGSAVGGATSDLGPTASNALKGAASGASSGFTRAELSGQNLQSATKQAELGGATGALTSLASDITDANPQERALLGSAIGTGLNYSNIFGTQPTSASQVGGPPPGGPTSIASTGQGTAPGAAGSTVLGSALGVSTDPGAPVQTTEGGTSRSNVWNQASLRNPDQEGGSNV